MLLRLFVESRLIFQLLLAEQLPDLFVHVAEEVDVAIDAIRSTIFDQKVSEDALELVTLTDQCNLLNIYVSPLNILFLSHKISIFNSPSCIASSPSEFYL